MQTFRNKSTYIYTKESILPLFKHSPRPLHTDTVNRINLLFPVILKSKLFCLRESRILKSVRKSETTTYMIIACYTSCFSLGSRKIGLQWIAKLLRLWAQANKVWTWRSLGFWNFLSIHKHTHELLYVFTMSFACKLSSSLKISLVAIALPSSILAINQGGSYSTCRNRLSPMVCYCV